MPPTATTTPTETTPVSVSVYSTQNTITNSSVLNNCYLGISFNGNNHLYFRQYDQAACKIDHPPADPAADSADYYSAYASLRPDGGDMLA